MKPMKGSMKGLKGYGRHKRAVVVARGNTLLQELVWSALYLGAFAALEISNGPMTSELARLTRSDSEAMHAIRIMRRSRERDRVWPALEWLREQRRIEASVRVES